MKFHPLTLDEAVGKILGHNIAGPDGHRLLNKGKPLTQEDIQRLRQAGREHVYVAELEPGDVDENQAAHRVAAAVQGTHLLLSPANAGRVNLTTAVRGVLHVDAARVHALNKIEGITLATLLTNTFVPEKRMVATVKVIPYAVPEDRLQQALTALGGEKPALRVDAMPARKVGLILTGSASSAGRLKESFERPLRARVSEYGSNLELIGILPLEEEPDEAALASLLSQAISTGFELILMAGETAIMDRRDIIPRAIERAGGSVECVGLPVDPGNMLMLANLDDTPILGAPGCARSLKTNAIDWVLTRLLAGERLTAATLLEMGYGGLLEDTSKRPMPRSGQNPK